MAHSSAILDSAKNVLIKISSLIDQLTKPNPKYFKNIMKFELAAIRHKAVAYIQLFIFLLTLIDKTIHFSFNQGDFIRWSCIIATYFVLFCSSRYHHEIFNTFYSFICIAYGPCVMNLDAENIHRAWLSAVHLPILVYLFTGSSWHFLLQVIVQYFYLNNVYYDIMERAIIIMAPEAYMKELVTNFNRTLISGLIFVVLTHIFMEKAFKRIMSLEKEKMEFEGQKYFLLSFSHELRNLINSLSGNIKLASLVENIPQRVKELLLNAEVCGEVLLHLVNNILDTGKIEIGELEINPAPTRIYDTLEKTWGVCAELVKRENIHGKMKIQKDLPKTLMVDHYRLTQILLNLVSNSIKFTDHGSIDISVNWINTRDKPTEKCFQPYPFNEGDEHDEGLFEKERMFSSLDESFIMMNVTLRKIQADLLKQSPEMSCSKRGVLKIVVSDTGCGMSQDETKRLFKKFSQVSSDPSKRRMGTGLGLFITKQLCEKMGGEIRVFSKKGKGTSFILCIPVDIAPEEENPESLWDLQSLKTFVANQRLKAMIVDDISFNHTVINSFFDKLGIEVVEIAENGSEAYRKYAENILRGKAIHIVTMDLDMPIMNGKEATRRIRKFEAERGLEGCFIPIISGNCTESEIQECLSKNGSIKADCFLKKPAKLEEILRVIAHHFIQLQKQKRL